jgi:hypothetical protein
MCEQRVMIENTCVGACKEAGTDNKSVCHSEEERFMAMSLEELREEVKKLRMLAVKAANMLHDLAEEGLPHRWQDIPKVSEEAYRIHELYHKAKKILEERSKGL